MRVPHRHRQGFASETSPSRSEVHPGWYESTGERMPVAMPRVRVVEYVHAFSPRQLDQVRR